MRRVPNGPVQSPTALSEQQRNRQVKLLSRKGNEGVNSLVLKANDEEFPCLLSFIHLLSSPEGRAVLVQQHGPQHESSDSISTLDDIHAESTRSAALPCACIPPPGTPVRLQKLTDMRYNGHKGVINDYQ